MKYSKYIPLLLIITLGLASWVLGLGRYISIETITQHQQFLFDFTKQNIFLSSVIYVILYIVMVSLSLPFASIITIMGGVFFGRFLGTFLTVFGASVGSLLVFLCARLAYGDLLEQKAGKWANKMRKGFEENAFTYLLTIRIMPVFPFFVVNLVAALFSMPAYSFLLATFLGIIPGTFVYSSIGAGLKGAIGREGFSLQAVIDPEIILALFGLAIISILPLIYKKFFKKAN